MKSISRMAVLVLACLLLTGCGEQKNSEKAPPKINIVFIPKVTGNAFFESANEGVQQYAAKYGFTAAYKGSSIAHISNQLEIIKKAVDDKADAICISALDATGLDAALKDAMAQGVKVVTWDADVSPDARMVMVSQGTPMQLGKMLVEMGAKSLQMRGLDPNKESIEYAWHYSQASVADQNSWQMAGEHYIKTTYPNWKNIAPQNYYSQQNPEMALSVGKAILEEHPEIDLIICNDSTSLPGQVEAVQQAGLTAKDITVTGFASPNAMKKYCRAGIIERWGLWDCQVQASLANYLAYYLASGNVIKVGDRLNVPEVGLIEVMPNSVLGVSGSGTASSGVVLLPQRTEFTLSNMDEFNF